MADGREELIDQGIGANQLALGDVAGALVGPVDQGISDNARGLGRVVRAERRPIDRGIRQTRDALTSVTGPLTQQIDAGLSEVAGQIAAAGAALSSPAALAGTIYGVGCNIGGRPTRVEVLADDTLRLTNERGEVSRGRWLTGDVIIADDWGGISGRVVGDGAAVLWSNGTWWDGCGIFSGGEGSPAEQAAAGGASAPQPAPAPTSLTVPVPGLPAPPPGPCCPFPVDWDEPLAFLFSPVAEAWRSRALAFEELDYFQFARSIGDLTLVRENYAAQNAPAETELFSPVSELVLQTALTLYSPIAR